MWTVIEIVSLIIALIFSLGAGTVYAACTGSVVSSDGTSATGVMSGTTPNGPFATPTSQVVSGMDSSCVLTYKQLGVSDITGFTGVSNVKLLSGITITPGTVSVGTYNETQAIAGIATGDSCIALQTSSPILGTTSLGLILGLAANSGKVFFGNSGLVGIALGSFTASLLCVH